MAVGSSAGILEPRYASQAALDALTVYETILYVEATGDDSRDGLSWGGSLGTIQEAVDRASGPTRIRVGPGEYDEAVTVSRAHPNVTIEGVGGRGSVFIAPSTANATAMTIHADDCTLINVGRDGDGTGHGLVNTGRRTRVYGSKIEGGTNGLRLTLGTVAQIGAATHGKGDDCWFIDCEVAYNTTGVMLVCTDYGAVTQVFFVGCEFHDNTKDFDETVGAGGSANVVFRGLAIRGCSFSRLEDGTEPTMYVDLNGNNANSGKVMDCDFPTALNGGKNLVSTALIWTSNKHTGGISNGQPS